jgi:hypothetical protein
MSTSTTTTEEPAYQPTLEDIQLMYPLYDIDDVRTHRILYPGHPCDYAYVHVDHPVLDHLMEYGINGTPFHTMTHRIIEHSWYRLPLDVVQAAALKIIKAEDMNAWHRVQRDFADLTFHGAAAVNGAAGGHEDRGFPDLADSGVEQVAVESV